MDFKNVAIDSMTILIPMDCFVRFPEGLYDQFMVINSETSEVIEESPRPVVFEQFGVKTRASI